MLFAAVCFAEVAGAGAIRNQDVRRLEFMSHLSDGWPHAGGDIVEAWV